MGLVCRESNIGAQSYMDSESRRTRERDASGLDESISHFLYYTAFATAYL